MEEQRVFGCEPNATSDEEYSNFAAEIVILPPQMRFTQQSSYVKIFCCLVLFLVAVMGNFTALVNLSRRKHQRSVVSLMMGHLAAADLLVTFFMIPLEGGFHLIVQWLDGNLACKFFLFLRAFALYLSSNVLVCVSLDRYSAILHPLKNYDARRRGKMMLCGAWICSFFYALPQLFIFHISSHPEVMGFPMCRTLETFTNQAGAIIYNSACLSATFVIPLVVIVFAQITIFHEIDGQICANEQDTEGPEMGDGKKITLRRSNTCSIEQAKRKTLRMTATTVLIFTICWGPYVVTIFWSIFNEEIFAWMQDWHWNVLFFAAALPPCLNPSLNARREIN